MSEEKKPDLHSGKDFDKYAYFESKAKNYGIIYEPRLEEVMASGDKRVAKDDDGKKMEGIRIEFHNHLKRFDRTKENEKIIKWLEKKCEEELKMPLRSQQLKQIFKPVKMIPETEVKAKFDEQDAEIARLKKELGKEPAQKTPAPAEEEKKSLDQVV